jgi:hypothetical protein
LANARRTEKASVSKLAYFQEAEIFLCLERVSICLCRRRLGWRDTLAGGFQAEIVGFPQGTALAQVVAGNV